MSTKIFYGVEKMVPRFTDVLCQSFVFFLSKFLRFDNKANRNKEDKFSPIREIRDIFISNCTRYYTPHRDCTVNEQLLSFRGKWSFRVYIKSKPDKYGLKLLLLNDAYTAYMVSNYSRPQ